MKLFSLSPGRDASTLCSMSARRSLDASTQRSSGTLFHVKVVAPTLHFFLKRFETDVNRAPFVFNHTLFLFHRKKYDEARKTYKLMIDAESAQNHARRWQALKGTTNGKRPKRSLGYFERPGTNGRRDNITSSHILNERLKRFVPNGGCGRSCGGEN